MKYTLILMLSFYVFLAGCWAINLYDLTRLDFEKPYKVEILRGAGVVAFPMSLVLAFVTFEEETKSTGRPAGKPPTHWK